MTKNDTEIESRVSLGHSLPIAHTGFVSGLVLNCWLCVSPKIERILKKELFSNAVSLHYAVFSVEQQLPFTHDKTCIQLREVPHHRGAATERFNE